MRYLLLATLSAVFVGCKKENPLEKYTGIYKCNQTCIDTWFYDPLPNSVDTNYYQNLNIAVKLVADDDDDRLYVDGNLMQLDSDGKFSSTNSPYHSTVRFIGDSISIEGFRDYRSESNSMLQCYQNGRRQ